MTRLPVTQVDSSFIFSTRLHWTPGFVHWNLDESIGHEWKKNKKPPLFINPSLSKKRPPSRVASCLGHFATEPVLGVQIVECGMKS